MAPRRLDRPGLHARLDRFDRWVVDGLLDAFEPAALKAMAAAEEKRPAANSSGPRSAALRDGSTRRGRRRRSSSPKGDSATKAGGEP